MPIHHSMALTNMPVEFVNITPLNPLISACDVKVLYHGKNRNMSYISKPVANSMAATLPNIPIVGEYLEAIQDFGDHAEELVINSQGIKFRKRTVPFGVVPADTSIWWQWFHDDDGVDREYMMCNGYLWTGRYPETTRILERGNGQSMELDGSTLVGQWATLQNETSEYFIIDEAVFSALCILGEDVEPCFESASVTAPNVVYSLDKDTFKTEMTQFMLDLKSALNSKEGGEKMHNLDNNLENQEQIVDPINNPVVDPVTEPVNEPGQDPVSDPAANPTNNDEPVADSTVEDEFAKKKSEDEEEDAEGSNDNANEEDEEDKKKKKPSYTLEEVTEYVELKAQYDELLAKFNEMEPEFTKLQKAEATRIKADKEAMIARFSILDEEDLKPVRENIDTYSLEEIESKLSVIAVRKKVNFNLDDSDKNDNHMNDPIVSFGADSHIDDGVPAWIKAVEARKRK